MTRNIVMRCNTPGTDEAFFYSERYTSNYRKKLILKDVFFKDWGDNGSSVYSGVVIRGFHSTNNDEYLDVTITEQIPEATYNPWLEGIVTRNSVRRDYSGIWAYDARNFALRNSIVIDGDDGITLYYEPRQAVYNCITAGSSNFSSRFQGMSESWEIAYNLFSRADDQVLVSTPYDPGFGFHDNWIDGNTYGFELQYTGGGVMVYKNRISGTRYGLYSHQANPNCSIFYNEYVPLSGYDSPDGNQLGTRQVGQYYHTRRHRGRLSSAVIKSYQHNFEIDAVRLYSHNMEILWDYDENAWRIYRRSDSGDSPMMLEHVLVPADTVVRATMKVKLAPSFSGTYPYLATSNVSGGQYNGTNNQLSHNTASSNRYSQDSGHTVQYT
ncbi:MAG: NosD domain-containing protein, partial [Candidatus Poseidoniales archaeon]